MSDMSSSDAAVDAKEGSPGLIRVGVVQAESAALTHTSIDALNIHFGLITVFPLKVQATGSKF